MARKDLVAARLTEHNRAVVLANLDSHDTLLISKGEILQRVVPCGLLGVELHFFDNALLAIPNQRVSHNLSVPFPACIVDGPGQNVKREAALATFGLWVGYHMMAGGTYNGKFEPVWASRFDATYATYPAPRG